MKSYHITDWSARYENNRTRELKSLDWVPTPNRHDGDGYTTILAHEKGEQIFGAWNAIIQIASRCDVRGTLLRDNKTPHSAASIARMSRFSEATIEAALEVLISDEVGWMKCEETQTKDEIPHNPAPTCGEVVTLIAPACGKVPIEGKGREGKGIEPPLPPAGGIPAAPGVVLLKFGSALATERVAEKWKAWMSARRAMGKKPKDWAAMFNEQIEWLNQFDEPTVIEILSASIRNGWQGLFVPKSSGNAPQSLHDGAGKVILGKEYERTIRRIETLKSTYGDLQTWTDQDRVEIAKLKARRQELQKVLGIQL